MAQQKRGLGRGLDSLFSDNAVAESGVVDLNINDIEPNRDQPRKEFDEQALAELADSISRHGLLQPITVRPTSNLRYQIVAGERRWRASRMAGLETVPVIIRELTDAECAEIALIENLQREDLNPVEEAMGYRSLMDTFGLTQEDVAAAVGKSRPAVANSLRLLGLPEDVLLLVNNGEISAGHGRALLAIKDESALYAAVEAAKKGATVREIERMASKNPKPKSKTDEQNTPSFYKEVELALSAEIGRKVRVTGANGKGVLQVEFYSDEDLADMAMRLGGEK
jgi:ParB family chromosome partitioning protein